MDFLLVANFKSHKTKDGVASWISKVEPVVKKESQATIVVAPAFPHLPLITQSPHLHLGSQDVSPFPPGSYTGAVAARELSELGVEYCIIGHSERRRYFHESHTEIANKADLLLGAGITPIMCLRGEDITPQLRALDDTQKFKILYCYEPPEDIGGTDTAPIANIEATTIHLRRQLGENAKIMYGGSVNAENIKSLHPLELNGVLVSSASLDAESFISIIKTIANGT